MNHDRFTQESLDAALGHYKPSFFFLKVETQREFREFFGTADEAVLMHEYVHFLQDVTTTFGLINLVRTVDYIKGVVKQVSTSKARAVRVPIRPQELDSHHAINENLFRVYVGDRRRWEDGTRPTVAEVRIRSTRIPQGDHAPSVVELKLAPRNMRFRFGALAIMESMAKLVAESVYPDSPKTPLLPYHLAEIVVDHVYPEFGRNRRNVAALCDVALHFYHPGEAFHKTLVAMRDKDFLPATAEEVYEFAYENVTIDEADNLLALFAEQGGVAAQQAADLFPSPQFADIATWGRQMIERGVDWRLREPSFLTKVFDMETAAARAYVLNDLMPKIGLPLVCNRNDVCATTYTGPDDQSPLLFRGIYEVYGLMRHGRKGVGCHLKPGCETSPENVVVDNTCDAAPWERAEREQLCLFGQVWKLWSLQGKSLMRTA